MFATPPTCMIHNVHSCGAAHPICITFLACTEMGCCHASHLRFITNNAITTFNITTTEVSFNTIGLTKRQQEVMFRLAVSPLRAGIRARTHQYHLLIRNHELVVLTRKKEPDRGCTFFPCATGSQSATFTFTWQNQQEHNSTNLLCSLLTNRGSSSQ